MSNYANLKSAIQSVIKTNGNNEITGQLLQTELLAMINTLGYGYQYMGVANPNTVPGTPDAKVFYLAYTAGTYTNFGGIVVSGFCALKYDTTWVKEDLPSGGINFTLQEDDLQFAGGQGLKLMFANRINGVNIDSGLDYFILRDDVSFQNQVTVGNTIYEIRYDFDLDGATVTVPSGCILKFVGGKITNGTLTGTNTKISAPDVQIFDDITIAGTWLLDRIFSVWFNADKYTIGNVMALNNANVFTEIFINGDYSVYVPKSGTDGIDIVANTKVFISGKLTKDGSSVSSLSAVFTITGKNVSVSGGIIDGNKAAFPEANEYGFGFDVSNSFGCEIVSVTIMNCHGDGIYIGGTNANKNFSVKNCEIYGCRRNGISIVFAQNVLVAETFIHDISGTAPGAGIDVEPYQNDQYNKNLVFRNCVIKDCVIGVSLSGGQASIENSIFENCKVSLSDYQNIIVINNSQNTSFVSCSFSTTGVRNTSYAITGSNPGKVLFENCTFSEEIAHTGNGSFVAIACNYINCKFQLLSAFYETISGTFKNCNIACAGISTYVDPSGLIMENCTINASEGFTMSGRTADAPAKHIRIIDCVANITATYYPIFGKYTEDAEITGCKLTLAGTRNLITFNFSKNVRIKNNTIVVGSNFAAIAFDGNAINCQAKDNLISAADGVTWTGAKYSGINNKTATSNIPGDPFYYETEHKMLMFNGTSVVNLDGSALS